VPSGWRLVVVIGGLSVFGPLCIDMYLPALPRISNDLQASTSSVQVTLTMCLIGIALGQLVIGPISDREGRRKPLLIGLSAFVVSSLVCSVVSDVYLLDVSRFVEGAGGAAGIVIARALVRDLFEGVRAARFFSTLMLMTGLGPILAPQIGAEILRVTSWRGIFVGLAVIGTALIASAFFRVPETLPPDKRREGGLGLTLKAMGVVARDGAFIRFALVMTLAFSGAIAYIAGSPFVLQGIYGLSPQMFGLAFAMNAGGLVLGSQANGHLVNRLGSRHLLSFGLVLMAFGGVVFLVCVWAGWLGLAGVLPSLFVVMFGLGFVGPNSMALAMQNHPESAGAAAALLGCAQFLVAAAIAPLVGIAGDHTALPMGLVIAGLTVGAVVVRLSGLRTDRSALISVEVVPS
jgi:DHA1 family bicyclomycin/chloramphenicol resistance-like MFS transporter